MNKDTFMIHLKSHRRNNEYNVRLSIDGTTVNLLAGNEVHKMYNGINFSTEFVKMNRWLREFNENNPIHEAKATAEEMEELRNATPVQSGTYKMVVIDTAYSASSHFIEDDQQEQYHEFLETLAEARKINGCERVRSSNIHSCEKFRLAAGTYSVQVKFNGCNFEVRVNDELTFNTTQLTAINYLNYSTKAVIIYDETKGLLANYNDLYTCCFCGAKATGEEAKALNYICHEHKVSSLNACQRSAQMKLLQPRSFMIEEVQLTDERIEAMLQEVQEVNNNMLQNELSKLSTEFEAKRAKAIKRLELEEKFRTDVIEQGLLNTMDEYVKIFHCNDNSFTIPNNDKLIQYCVDNEIKYSISRY